MKLFVFEPPEQGWDSYIVASETEARARELVRARIVTRYDQRELRDDVRCERIDSEYGQLRLSVYNTDDVVTHDNAE